jgi:hypothetical protein
MLKRHFLNRTFSLDTGEISIDEVGDRIPSVVVKFFDNSTGKLKVRRLHFDLIEHIHKVVITDWQKVRNGQRTVSLAVGHSNHLAWKKGIAA